ncbi:MULTISPECIES: hypothetical protein [Microtetraspora]|uniref:Uncharacterized protein n=1 Tax=Microtetraspora glauca TaxID=1996 RepID=A0ABV3GC46_MICGL|nr:hypothetical protein [Microtetraspora sp. AC03309]
MKSDDIVPDLPDEGESEKKEQILIRRLDKIETTGWPASNGNSN